MYVPATAREMTTPVLLRVVTKTEDRGGKPFPIYGDSIRFNCNFKAYGGTETVRDGVTVIEDTAQITCFYHPLIIGNCHIIRLRDGAEYEIIGEPDNIEQRNRYLTFKVRRYKGGA